MMTDADIQAFFAHYAETFNRALAGAADMDAVADLYAPAFIAATPAGVMTGENDDRLKQAMAQGYERYRALGTKAMRLRAVRRSPIDAQHCLAHVEWRGIHARPDGTDAVIDFEVHYLVRMTDEGPCVFGWISGDEEALLRQHGIVQDRSN